MLTESRVTARANIALAKYWGKIDIKYNLPATPSISITLEGLETETSVRFDKHLKEDRFVLNGKPAGDGETRKVTLLLDHVRKEAKLKLRAEVVSENRFPTAAGLASSASGFAALAAAATNAAGLHMSRPKLSQLARQSSASAARSIFGGFVELPAGKPGDERLSARPIAPPIIGMCV